MDIYKKISFYFAILGILAALIYSTVTIKPLLEPAFSEKPSYSPFFSSIAASGIVESADRNILIGVPKPGIITKIYVKSGDFVKKGDPLFQLDSSDEEAKYLVLKADLEVAEATHEKQNIRLKRLEAISDPRALSQDELKNLQSDVKIANAQIEAAKAKLNERKTLIQQLLIKAPEDGVVLQENIRVGEYANNNKTAIIFGNLTQYTLKVSIDEEIFGQFDKDKAAVAFPKNNSFAIIPLKFLKIEPYVIPKKDLTGYQDERIDTRVVQVIYTFNPPENIPVYVGMQMDVFIEKKRNNG